MKDSCGGGMQQEAFPFPTKNFFTAKLNQALFKAQNIFSRENIIPFHSGIRMAAPGLRNSEGHKYENIP